MSASTLHQALTNLPLHPRAGGIFAGRTGPPVLCLHGFTGTPFSVRPLVRNLGRSGWRVHAPLITGHGRKISDLASTRWGDWYATAEAALGARVASMGGPVAVVGYSLGGLLALELALRHPYKVGALVLMAVPIRLARLEEQVLRLCQRVLPEILLHHPILSVPKTQGIDVLDSRYRCFDPSLAATPIGAAASLLDLADRIRPRLGEIRQPTLLIHSTGDRVVPFNASLELSRTLGSKPLEYQWLSRSRHALCLDVDRQLILDAVTNFLTRHHSR